MKTHTTGFKENISLFGKEIDSKITYELNGETIELGTEDLNSVTPHYEGAILKSVMKQLDIDSNVEIPLETILTYEFGVKVGNSYEYISFGNYVVYNTEKQEDTNSYKITCYDKMLYSMKSYENMNITYPITIRDYINAICTHLGLDFKNKNETFANYDKEIPNELYLDENGDDLGYTFRDVLDELAQVTASTICINENDDELEIRYISNTNDTIDEEYLKDINVNFGEKFGPVNTIVLSRSAGTDNIYYPSVLPQNPYELKISDNQIMNGNDRADYMPDIYNKLNGLEYYINDFSSPGIAYYNLCDRYNVKISNNTYSCVIFNDELNVTQGLEENIYTEMPEQTETDYTKADKTDRKLNQTNLIVNKQEQTIQSMITNYLNFLQTSSGINYVEIENVFANGITKLEITGQMSLLYPENALYPSDTLYPLDSYLIIEDENENKTKYLLNINYLNVGDKYIYTYEFDEENNGYIASAKIKRNDNSEEELEAPIFEMPSGNYKIYLESFTGLNYSAEYIIHNNLTNTLATSTQLSTSITQTKNSIDLLAQQKVNKNNIIADLNVAIQDGKGTISLTGDQVVIDSENFKVTGDGTINAKNGVFKGTINGSYISGSKIRIFDDFRATSTEQLYDDPTFLMTAYEYYDDLDHEYNTYMSGGLIDMQDDAGGYVKLTTGLGAGEIKCKGIIWGESFERLCLESEKKDFEKFNNALKIIKNTDIYKYRYKNKNDNSKKDIGIVIGKKYKYSKEITNDENNAVNLSNMVSVCFQAIKEQQEIIEKLQKEMEEIKCKK